MHRSLSFFFVLFGLQVSGQFHYTFRSEPSGAQVTLNGEPRCTTPCAVKYRWNEAKNDRLLFEVKAPGYRTWSDTLDKKPWQFDETAWVELKRDLKDLGLDSSSALVAFDKLVVDLKDGSVIGQSTDKDGKSTPIKWEGTVKVGERSFERAFYEILMGSGVRTPVKESARLFSDGSKNRRMLPRYSVGVQLLDVHMDARHEESDVKNMSVMACSTKFVMDWQVLDHTSNTVVLNVRNEGASLTRSRLGHLENDNLTAFENGLVEFLEEGRFVELLKANPSGANFASEVIPAKSFGIGKVEVPNFTALGDMIRYADKSCVTVITDGGHGSGVIINSEGFTLSAYHVVDGVNKIEVQFSDGLRQEAKVIASDRENDIVLLDISGSGFRPLPLGDPKDAGLGDEVVTIGTPADVLLGQSVSRGILSGKRNIEGKVYLQTDVSVSPGNSGGPLLNARGEVLGIVVNKLVGAGIEGLGFAVPMDRVKVLMGITTID